MYHTSLEVYFLLFTTTIHSFTKQIYGNIHANMEFLYHKWNFFDSLVYEFDVGSEYKTPIEQQQNMTQRIHTCYIIRSQVDKYTYIGYTSNFQRRLRQHNREIVGGAKHTEKHYPFEVVCLVRGFATKHDALSFEWYLQHTTNKNRRTVRIRPRENSIINNLNSLLMHERWCELTVEWF